MHTAPPPRRNTYGRVSHPNFWYNILKNSIFLRNTYCLLRLPRRLAFAWGEPGRDAEGASGGGQVAVRLRHPAAGDEGCLAAGRRADSEAPDGRGQPSAWRLLRPAEADDPHPAACSVDPSS